MNIKLLGPEESIRVMVIMKEEFSDDCAGKVYDAMKTSLITFLKSSTDKEFIASVNLLFSSGISSDFSQDDLACLRQRARGIQSGLGRIRVSEAIPEEERSEYLGPVALLPLETLVKFSEEELAKLVPIDHKTAIIAIERKLVSARSVSRTNREFTDRLIRVVILLPNPQDRMHLMEIFFTAEIESLFVEQQIDVAWIGCRRDQILANFVWRLGRDKEYFRNIDFARIVRLIDACKSMDDPSVILRSLAVPIGRRVVAISSAVDLVKVIASIPGNAWIDHPQLAKSVLELCLFRIPEKSYRDEQVLELWNVLVHAVGISDWTIVEASARRICKNSHDPKHLITRMRDIVEKAQELDVMGQKGNMVISRILAINDGDLGETVFAQARDGLITGKSIPLHLGLSELRSNHILTLLDHLSPPLSEGIHGKHLLNIELLAEAATVIRSTFLEKLEMVKKFSLQHNFPVNQLIQDIANNYIREMSLTELFEFVSSCAHVRCPFNSASLIEYIGVCDLRKVNPSDVVDFVENSSSLGMLSGTPQIASRLLTSFTSNIGLDSLNVESKAQVSARILSSLLVSLLVPPNRHLESLLSNVRGNEKFVDAFDLAVIREMGALLDRDSLTDINHTDVAVAELDDITVSTMKSHIGQSFGSHVVSENVMLGETSSLGTADFVLDAKQAISIAIPSDYYWSSNELTQLKKFKLFILHHRLRNPVIKSWIRWF